MVQDIVQGRLEDELDFGHTYPPSYSKEKFISLFETEAKFEGVDVIYHNINGGFFSWEWENREVIYEIEQKVMFSLGM